MISHPRTSSIKLIALDLDDTLLRTDLSISEENKRALQRAENMGIHIVLASGRNYHSMRRYAEELFIHRRGDFLIGSNGAQLIKASTGALLEDLALPAAFCKSLVEDFERKGYFWQLYLNGKIYCSRLNKWALIDHQLSGLPLEVIGNLDEVVNRDQTKIVIGGEPAQIESIYHELIASIGDQTEIVTSKPYFLEVLPKGASKGAALERLTARLHLSMDSVLAIGDARNDLEMIKRVGWGCAPANAAEEIRAVARFVSLKTNEEDAVADILAHLVFSEEVPIEIR